MYNFKMIVGDKDVVFEYQGPKDDVPLTSTVDAETLYLFLDILRKRPIIEGTRISLLIGGKGGRGASS